MTTISSANIESVYSHNCVNSRSFSVYGRATKRPNGMSSIKYGLEDLLTCMIILGLVVEIDATFIKALTVSKI
jgi:hypothetical protein